MTDLIQPIGPPDPAARPVEPIVKRELEDERQERREHDRKERERDVPAEPEQAPPVSDADDEDGHVDVMV
jgi:hypothetical protein